jgi:MFS family permease
MPGWFQNNRFLLAFAGLSSLMGVSVGMAKVVTSLYALHLGASEQVVGMIAGAQSVGVLLMSLPLGFLVERHGPGRIFMLGSVAAGLIYTLLPFVRTPGLLVICTAAVGIFMPFRFVSLNMVFLEQLSALGEARAGWYRGTHVAGMFFLGPLLAATLIKALDFAGSYWVVAALFGVSIVASPRVFKRYAPARVTPRSVSWSTVRAQLGLVVREPELRGACLADFIAQIINNYYAVFIVVLAVTVIGLSAPEASTLVAAQGLTYMTALLALGGVVKRLGGQGAYVLSCTAISIALVLLGVARGPYVLWCGGMLLGLGLGLLQIVNLTRFARSAARVGPGRIAGLNALVGPAGGLIGGLGGGFMGARVGLQNMFLLFVPLVGLLYWQLVAQRTGVPAEA